MERRIGNKRKESSHGKDGYTYQRIRSFEKKSSIYTMTHPLQDIQEGLR